MRQITSTAAITLLTVILGSVKPSLGLPSPEEFSRFKACVDRCSKMNMLCNDNVKDWWMNYYANKAKIARFLKKCCLLNENRDDANPDDSFATCVRINCKAELWGCQIVKKHSGFLSQDEREHLKGNHTA